MRWGMLVTRVPHARLSAPWQRWLRDAMTGDRPSIVLPSIAVIASDLCFVDTLTCAAGPLRRTRAAQIVCELYELLLFTRLYWLLSCKSNWKTTLQFADHCAREIIVINWRQSGTIRQYSVLSNISDSDNLIVPLCLISFSFAFYAEKLGKACV